MAPYCLQNTQGSQPGISSLPPSESSCGWLSKLSKLLSPSLLSTYTHDLESWNFLPLFLADAVPSAWNSLRLQGSGPMVAPLQRLWGRSWPDSFLRLPRLRGKSKVPGLGSVGDAQQSQDWPSLRGPCVTDGGHYDSLERAWLPCPQFWPLWTPGACWLWGSECSGVIQARVQIPIPLLLCDWHKAPNPSGLQHLCWHCKDGDRSLVLPRLRAVDSQHQALSYNQLLPPVTPVQRNGGPRLQRTGSLTRWRWRLRLWKSSLGRVHKAWLVRGHKTADQPFIQFLTHSFTQLNANG